MSNYTTSGDIAWAAANNNRGQLNDAFALIGWLADRVRYLEAEAGRIPSIIPELPSAHGTFGWKVDEKVKEAWASIMEGQP